MTDLEARSAKNADARGGDSPHPHPEGRMPKTYEVCPLCNAGPSKAHRDDCPWLLWAKG